MSRPVRTSAFALSLLLTLTGLLAIVVRPQAAGADLSKQAPEFVVGPDDTVAKEFTKVLVGSAEVRPNPDECRDDPAMGLTCGAHRLKVDRSPGFKLTVILEWTAAGASGTFLPDVDLYLFDDATAKFDSAEVGGAGTAMPEQISIVPEQDEYDIVVQAWGGAITGYKITVFYSDKPIQAIDLSVTPDVVLNPDRDPFRNSYTSALATPTTGSPVLYPVVQWNPDDCRNNPAYEGLCDVYRLKLNRNLAKDALNFVVIELSWEARQLPDLALAVAGLGLGYFPDLDMYVWDSSEHFLEGVGGEGDGYPERIGFVATQDVYDIVIQVGKGAVSGYTLGAFLSDEVFDKPFEILDPVTGKPAEPTFNPDTGTFDVPVSGGGTVTPTLDFAPIDVDEQIAGIGLGTTEQFDAEQALRIGEGALRNPAANAKSPSGWMLVLTLGIVPAGVVGVGVSVLRRRRSLLF